MIETKEELLSPRGKELFHKKAARAADSYLRRLREMPGTPEAVLPFLSVLDRVFVQMRSPYEGTRRKTIGTFCAMVPNELIYAAGAYPLRLCSGSYTAYSISDGLAARDACPLVKAVAGFAAANTMPLYDDCTLMIVPITCDCKKKIAGLLEGMKETAVVHIPISKYTDEDIDLFRSELYRIIPRIEEITSQKITASSLAKAINQVGRAQYEMARFLEYRRNDPPLLSGAQTMAVMNASAYMPAGNWAAQMERLNRELAGRLEQGQFTAKRNRPRIMLTGSPITFPNLKLPLLIEEMGGVLAADETCLGERALYDPVSVTDPSFDGMIRGIASRYIAPCTCPVFADNSQRIYRIRQFIKAHHIQGVVYHVLRGCLVYDYEYMLMEEELEKLDIPVIRVESDYTEEDVEQLRIRIEAFIETIKLREYKKEKEAGRV